MKLKKIASLALAGIMAVSMLAGCKTGSSSSSNSDSTVVTPVDNSLAAYMNDEMSDKQKAVITFSSDATVQAALEKVAATISSNDLSAEKNKNINFYDSAATKAFREAVEAVANKNINDAFKNVSSDDVTAASLFIVPAYNGDEAMKKAVFDYIKAFINSTNMPTAQTGVGVDYRNAYTGKIAVTKVTSGDDKNVAYVVGVVIDMTVTELPQA